MKVVKKEKSGFVTSDDALARAGWLGETGDPLAGRARGAHNQLGVRMCRIDFWRRTFISRRRQRDSGWSAEGGDESGDASVVGIRLGWGRMGRRIMGRVWKSLEPSQPW